MDDQQIVLDTSSFCQYSIDISKVIIYTIRYFFADMRSATILGRPMNAADSEIRSRYLALALDARRLMDVLIPFVDSGKRNESLDIAVREAIDALTSVTEGVGTNVVHSNLAFDEYEQVLTLDEIKNQKDRKTVIRDLEQIASPDGGEAQRQAAMRVLEFFFAVESRALQYYNRPPAIVSYAT
jgi:hypothetical protein